MRKSIFIALIVGMFCGIISLGWGYTAVRLWQAESQQYRITRDTLITRMQQRGVLVTRTIIIDQESRIGIPRQSDWNALLWGKELVTSGRVRVDLGVDLSLLAKDNTRIRIDENSRTIYLNLPTAEILSSSVIGKLEVTTEGTILTRLFDNNTNADYQLALSELTAASETVVRENVELRAEARADVAKLLGDIFIGTGYEVKLEP